MKSHGEDTLNPSPPQLLNPTIWGTQGTRRRLQITEDVPGYFAEEEFWGILKRFSRIPPAGYGESVNASRQRLLSSRYLQPALPLAGRRPEVRYQKDPAEACESLAQGEHRYRP